MRELRRGAQARGQLEKTYGKNVGGGILYHSYLLSFIGIRLRLSSKNGTVWNNGAYGQYGKESMNEEITWEANLAMNTVALHVAVSSTLDMPDICIWFHPQKCSHTKAGFLFSALIIFHKTQA